MLPYRSRLERRNRLLEANGSELAAFRPGNVGHIGLAPADLQHSFGPDRNVDQEIKGKRLTIASHITKYICSCLPV